MDTSVPVEHQDAKVHASMCKGDCEIVRVPHQTNTTGCKCINSNNQGYRAAAQAALKITSVDGMECANINCPNRQNERYHLRGGSGGYATAHVTHEQITKLAHCCTTCNTDKNPYMWVPRCRLADFAVCRCHRNFVAGKKRKRKQSKETWPCKRQRCSVWRRRLRKRATH